jgi:hypothetical protein
VGQAKLARYGEQFIAAVREHRARMEDPKPATR